MEQSLHSEIPRGKPDIMFQIPEFYNSRDYFTRVHVEYVMACTNMYATSDSEQLRCR